MINPIDESLGDFVGNHLNLLQIANVLIMVTVCALYWFVTREDNNK